MSECMDVSSLVGAMLEALRASSATPEQRDAVVFQSLMMILGDNWTPFDAVRAPLQTYVLSKIEGDTTREEYVASLAHQLVLCLGDDADVSLELVSVCREDADPLGLTREICTKHFRVIIDGLLDFVATPEQPFSRALRSAVMQFIGEWFDGLCSLFLYGSAALPGLLQHLTQLGGRVVATRSPQHAPMAQMASPILLGFLKSLYAEYRATNPQSAPA